MPLSGTEYAVETMLPQFRAAGEWLEAEGLVTPGAGNMSMWTPDGVLITREGAALGGLNERDLCLVGRTTRPPAVNPSLDTPIHRVVYILGGGRALIHARPPAVLAVAANARELIPGDGEGKRLFGRVPVLAQMRDIVRQVAEALAERTAVIVRGHGCYVRGADLAEALHHVELLEASARQLQAGK